MRISQTRSGGHPGAAILLGVTCLPAMLVIGLTAQTPSTARAAAQIEFNFENAGLDPQRYSITVDESGHGHYHSEPGPHKPDAEAGEMPSQPQETDIQLSPATRDYLFATARARQFFARNCDDGKGKVAFEGKKQVSYHGADGTGSCTYNWSKDDRIDRLTHIFGGISETLEAGSRLAIEHRHDPLALDHELSALALDFKEGRAFEVGNIAGELQSIVQDESVMVRARSRAGELLRASNRTTD